MKFWTTTTTEETAEEEKTSKENAKAAETPNAFINAFKTFLSETIPTFGEEEETAFKRANDAVDETVKNIDERVKIITESEGFKSTKSKVDETVQTTMAKVSQYADQLLDAAAVVALEEDDIDATVKNMTCGEDEEAAFMCPNDAVDETVKNIDETVKTITASEEFKNTKFKVDETVQTTMAKVSQYADQLFDAAAEVALEKDDVTQPNDESRNDVGEDAMTVVTEIRAA